MFEDGYLAGQGALWLVRLVALLALGGAIGGVAFVAAQATRQGARQGTRQATRQATGDGNDRNWRFLFLCWSDAVAIWILYVAVDFTWMFEDLVGLIQSVLVPDGYGAGYLTSHYLVLVIRLVCYALVMGIAIRLFLRIRRFIDSG